MIRHDAKVNNLTKVPEYELVAFYLGRPVFQNRHSAMLVHSRTQEEAPLYALISSTMIENIAEEFETLNQVIASLNDEIKFLTSSSEDN